MTMQVPPILDTLDLPAAVLRAAVLDGELYALGDGYRPVDLPLDPLARAASLRSVTGRDQVLSDATAAWVWGAVPEPGPPYALLVPRSAAVGHPTGAEGTQLRIRVARVRLDDVVRLGGIAVTSPLRTAIDLICLSDDTWDENAVRRLLEIDGRSAVDLVDDLHSRTRLAGRKRAFARAQVLVTR